MKKRKIVLPLFLSLSVLTSLAIHSTAVSADVSVTEMEIKVSKGNTISVSRFNREAGKSLLWLPSEHGLTGGDKKITGQLAKLGFDVWVTDLLNSYFLVPAASSIGKIPVSDIAGLLNQFLANNKNQKIVLASGRTAVVLLQALKASKRPAGVILISPNLYTGTPEPGSSATYLPVTSQTNQNIKIFQPQLSPWYWQREAQTGMLESGGSRVDVNVLPGVRDRFYFRPDALASEKKLQDDFPALISEAIKLITR